MQSAQLKTRRYERILQQAKVLLKKSPDITAQFATINALVYHKIPYIFWAGFYRYGKGQLEVSAYQGPLACQILPYPKGMCWKSVLEKRCIIVPDIRLEPDHIACDSRSRSEIVIPLIGSDGTVYGVFDADSDRVSMFDQADEYGLTQLMNLLNLQA